MDPRPKTLQFNTGGIPQRSTATSSSPAVLTPSGAQKTLQFSSGAPKATSKKDEDRDGFLETLIKDPLETLLVKPADRVAELAGRTGVFGKDIKKGYEIMADEGEGRRIFGMDIEPQRAFGDGGAKQIAGEALKSASYLYTGGKAAPAAQTIGAVYKGAAPNIITQAALQTAKTGAIAGGAYGAGEEMTQKDSTLGSILKEGAVGGVVGGGTGGILGAATPVAVKAVSPAMRLLRREEEISKALDRIALTSGRSDLSRDSEIAGRALREIDVDGIKTNAELVDRIDEEVGAIRSAQDKALETDPTKRNLTQLQQTIDVNGQKVKKNYVSEALDQLETEYVKTNNIRGATQVRQLREKANGEGLTVKEVNELARLHAKDLNAFNPVTGTLSSGLAKQTAENTRQGVKETGRALFGNKVSQEADRAMSDLLRLKAIATKRANEVEKLRTATLDPSVSKRVGALIEQAVNIVSLGTSRGLFSAVMKSAGKTTGKANAIELEKQLARDLKLIQEANAKGASEQTIINKLNEFIKAAGEKPVLMLEAPKPKPLFGTEKGTVSSNLQEAVDMNAVEKGAATQPKAGPYYQQRVAEIQNRLEQYLTPEEMAVIQMGPKPRPKNTGLPTAPDTPPDVYSSAVAKMEKYLTPEEMEIIQWGPKPKSRLFNGPTIEF